MIAEPRLESYWTLLDKITEALITASSAISWDMTGAAGPNLEASILRLRLVAFASSRFYISRPGYIRALKGCRISGMAKIGVVYPGSDDNDNVKATHP